MTDVGNITPESISDDIFRSRIKVELQNLIEKYKGSVKKTYLFDYLYKTEGVVILVLLLPLIFGKFFLKDTDAVNTNQLVVLCVILIILLSVFSLTYYETKKARNNEHIDKIYKSIKYLSHTSLTKKKKKDFPLEYTASSNFTYIFRNDGWELLPSNLLIKGDIFLLRVGDLIPCQCVEYDIYNNVYGNKYTRNEMFMPLSNNDRIVNLVTKCPKEENNEYLPSFHLFSFVACENVSISIIKKYIDESLINKRNVDKKKKAIDIVLTEKTHTIYIYIWVILFISAAIATTIHLLEIQKDMRIPEILVFQILIYFVFMTMTTLPFVHRIFTEAIYGYGCSQNCTFENYFEEAHNEKEVYSNSSLSSSSYGFSSTTNNSSYITTKKIGFFYTLKTICSLIWKGIKIDKHDLYILSDCSLLGFLDSSGIIVNTNHNVTEICIFTDTGNKKNPSSKKEDAAHVDVISQSRAVDDKREANASDSNLVNRHISNENGLDIAKKNYYTNDFNNILTIIDIFMDNKSMYAYQRIQNIKILHSLFLISYYTQIPKYIRLLDNFKNNILNYMNQREYSYLYICLCDIGNISIVYNKFLFHKLFFCIENKGDYRMYKKKCAQLKEYKKEYISSDNELPYYIDDDIPNRKEKKNEKKEMEGNNVDKEKTIKDETNSGETSLGINIYDNLTSQDNFAFIFILYEKKKDKYHMFLKGQLEALVNKCMFYFDGKTIKKLKRRKKKELRILNMQWVSSGIESICFAYRPLSAKEVEYLNKHFKKNIYIMTISKNKNYNLKNFHNDDKSFCVKENEQFLSHLLSTTIFIGNSAVKLLTNNEIQSRINDFYDAGIRFVHFSRSNETQTRSVANLLGLETSWNTSISLSLNDKHCFKNRDGKVVIPSGINNIKKHIAEIDDIPLRVSLYSGCNKFNTMEMIKILLENNEIITCIGDSLNCNNFDIFKLCNYSISILLPSNDICKDCYGKKEKSNPFDYSSKRNPLLAYASYVNSFPCSLIIEKQHLDLSQNTVELVYKLLKRARIYKKNISLIVFYFYFFYSLISFLTFFILISFLPPFVSMADYLLFVLFIIPVISICLLSNNNNSTVMNDITDKVFKHELFWRGLVFFLIKWLPLLLYIFIVMVYYSFLITDNFVKNFIFKNETNMLRFKELVPLPFWDKLVYHCSQEMLLKSICRCQMMLLTVFENNKMKELDMLVSIFHQIQIFFFFSFSIFFFVSSLSFSDKFEPLFKISCIHNSKAYFLSLVVFLMFSLAYTIIRVLMLSPLYPVQYPDNVLIILLVVFNLLVLFTNEILKRIEEKIKIHRQKYLKVLFGTRLGMWSPK